MEKLNDEDKIWVHFKEINLRWIVAEAIHSTNNFLGGIPYATYFLKEDSGESLEENLQMINQRVEGAADILNALFVLVSPLKEKREEAGLKDILTRIGSLFSQKLKSTKSEIRLEMDHGLKIKAKEDALICQVVYTWLWQRFSIIAEPVLMKVALEVREGETWLKIIDEGPEMGFSDRLEEPLTDLENMASSERSGFALESLKYFKKYLKMKWGDRVDKGVEFSLRISPIE